MSRPLRIISAVLAVLLGLLAPGLVTTQTAAAAARPVVSKIGSGAGPIKPTVVVIKGSHLNGATAVTFGSKKGKVIRVLGSGSIEVRTPKGVRAGTVSVRVRAHGSWSKKSSRARYTFVAAPQLSKLSPASGSYQGGQRVTLKGKNLAKTARVRFGTARAKIVSRKKDRVVVKAPIGVLGRARVTVTTPGGTSRSKSYLYEKPAAKSATKVTTLAGTAKPTSVDWVTGGYDPDTDKAEPWVVGLPQGATVPVVGKPFLVKPGTRVFPSGLVGRVTDVAVQADESVRVTVAPTAFDTSLKRLQMVYSGGLNALVARRGNATETGRETKFSLKGPTALFCKSNDGQSVSFGADLTMTVADIDVVEHLDAGSLVRKPSYDAAVTSEIKTTGKITVAAAATCKEKPEWGDAHRLTFLLGGGATFSIAPTWEIKVSAKGTWSVLDRTRTTFAVDATLGEQPHRTSTSRNVESREGGALSFEAEVTGGVSIQLGILDRAGLESKALLGVSVALEATGANVCVTGKLFLKLTVGVFLDVIVARWEAQALAKTFDLRTVRGCVLADEPAAAGEPEIVSARLPDAQVGADYAGTLVTADDREGSWSVARAGLPHGLVLNGDNGAITGTPTGPVGDYPVIVDFTDTDGRIATTIVRIYVEPIQGIGGGDIQVTLRWAGGADLDLHVTDPADEEIYYHHPGSASGGILDQDANAGCRITQDDNSPVENIYWPPHAAPVGNYTAWVHVFDPCSDTLDWHLTIRRNGLIIIDQIGNGESPAFSFGVGNGAGVRIGGRPKVTTHYPPK